MNEIDFFIDDIRRTNNGIKLVFTNGIFDILHRGHVAYLEKAKAMGDLLILGLNSDESARRLKGKNRPYVGQDDRAFILSRLESVDIVSIFDDDTPNTLIENIKPDVLVKGGDYNLDEIVGRDFVEKYGGKVCTIPFIKDKSTTSLIDKIKNEYGV
ncbi:MAG: D-glycero-beta-D-manno-heptose 1-phosphate adenylyltransferase [Calditrichaceae bacterium]